MEEGVSSQKDYLDAIRKRGDGKELRNKCPPLQLYYIKNRDHLKDL